MTRPFLSVSKIAKSFGDVAALAEVSFDCHAGETIALLGPSGCGKSTLLRLVAGLDAPTGGRIEWTELEGGAPAPGEIGFVFQDPTLMPWASVADNIALPQKLTDAALDEQVLKPLIAQMGLAGFEDALPRALSGGMKMRASLARALITKPKVLLLDEPFAALDEITRHALNDLLLGLKQAGALTSLFVTHSVFESVYLADRVLVMSARPGRVHAEFTIEAPADRTRAFRFSPEYAAQCQAISAALAEAMEVRHAA